MSSKIIATGIAETVLQALEGQGLPIKRDLNIELPDFPADITLVEDQDLMVLASRYMENMNFIRTQVAIASLVELEADNEYDTLVSKGLLGKTTGKSTEKAALLRASVLTDQSVVDASESKAYHHAYRKMLETYLENIERCYSLASRELTRRTSSSRQWGNRFTP
jgi:hypothetical protein